MVHPPTMHSSKTQPASSKSSCNATPITFNSPCSLWRQIKATMTNWHCGGIGAVHFLNRLPPNIESISSLLLRDDFDATCEAPTVLGGFVRGFFFEEEADANNEGGAFWDARLAGARVSKKERAEVATLVFDLVLPDFFSFISFRSIFSFVASLPVGASAKSASISSSLI